MKCKRCRKEMKHEVLTVKGKTLDAYSCVCGYKKGQFK